MTTQSNLDFDGTTFDRKNDSERLTGQLRRVYDLMYDQRWRTLSEIKAELLRQHEKHDSEAGISARLRDLRKTRFGSHTINRRHKGGETKGLWEYQLIDNEGRLFIDPAAEFCGWYRCPKCYGLNVTRDIDACPDCGQQIKWSEN